RTTTAAAMPSSWSSNTSRRAEGAHSGGYRRLRGPSDNRALPAHPRRPPLGKVHMGTRSTALTMAILAAMSTGATAAAPPSALAVGQQVRGEITSADAINWRDGSRSELYAIGLAADEGVRFEVS